MYEFEAQEIEDATDGFSPSRLIGKGSHGSVYSGVLKDGRVVAVKKQSLALENLRDDTKLRNEALILSSIPPNPCTVAFVGAAAGNVIVTDYMPNGTLHHLLHLSDAPPPWPTRLRIALQLASALRRLHDSNPSIVHRDVKSANILFDGDWNARLADFGLAARLCDGDDVASKLPAGTLGYIDPGYTAPGMLTVKIDVFSYGVVLLELVAARRVIDVTRSPASLVEWAVPLIERGRGLEICDKRIRMPLYTRRAITKLLGVAARCLAPRESDRPSMREVVSNLEMTPMNRYSWTMDCVREMIGSMMRRKKARFSGKCVAIVTNEACADNGGGGGDSFSKGRLLVREILADITLK
ncbi:serine/threonine-protein kinase-like protein At5g23170 [Salvia miltiorrhiza]|uniref:serine/threonine-protein kinase-like protein At5g23170 n=1 Tax=Salvia miltiorrhiza TaxID=226208 RepID=UPI0025AB61D4|nr:serine/threonine-protein kinase-like protein At5g23170 [Salvia miltiorrhiza]